MSRPRILMVYFSRTGNTRRLAEAIARELACDIEVIRESRNRQGFTEFVKSCFEALFRHHPKIETVQHDPSAYDLVILGTPVWAGSMSSPVRSYIASYQGVFRNVAFFCTMAHQGSRSTFLEMQRLIGRAPAATCAVTTTEIAGNDFRGAMEQFVRTVNHTGESVAAEPVA